MYEPPSPELTRLLLESGACRAADLRACRRIVRRLCRDLPAFDSVWIDALVQLRRLTPFQARILGSARPEAIRVGPLVVVERLGRETVAARQANAKEARFAVKRLRGPLGQDVVRRLGELPERLQAATHAGVVGPHVVDATGEGLSLISRRIEGSHLAELLVRRGRYAAAVVSEIGRQLLEALLHLHQAGLVHGGIQLTSVRLSPEGRAVLVDAGIRPAIEPEVSVTARVPPERFDALAPEIVGVGRRATAASDLYALGCVLWQLLAGRPPFPGADPLVKIAAHQTRRIEDVRRWSPDVPPSLAAGIAWLTQSDPARRPAAGELLAKWKAPRASGRRRLAAFVRAFRSPPAEERSGRGWSWASVAAAVFALSGLVAAMANQGLRTTLLSIAGQLGPQPAASAENPAPVELGQPPFAIPAANPEGLIELDREGPWLASTVECLGPLVIRSSAGVTPVIVVRERALVLRAQSVRLQGLIVRSEEAPRTPTGMVVVTSGLLEVESCEFERGERRSQSAIGWRRLEGSSHAAAIRQSLFWGSGPAVYLNTAAEVAMDDCLKIGDGPLIDLALVPAAGSSLTMRLSRVTLRQSGAVFRWRLGSPGGEPGRVTIEPTHCTFDLEPGLALVDLVAAEPQPQAVEALAVVGEETLVRMDAEAAWVSPGDGRRTALPAEHTIAVEGLRAEPIRFAGELTRRPADSRITP